jgi:uncharacterized protein with NRDE domain
MCLIVIAHEHHPRYPLVVAANRDELYARPTAPAGFWEERPDLLAGRDLLGGGTWLGITRSGRFAAVTNYREPGETRIDAPSRGQLVTGYLCSGDAPLNYLQEISERGADYNGFNLIAGSSGSMAWYSNRGGDPRELESGVYGVSNHLLDTPWPKVERGKAGVAAALGDDEPDTEALFRLLADHTLAGDDALPDTGVGRDWERTLSPLFISSENYGTRSSTVLTVDTGGRVRFAERSYAPGGLAPENVALEFPLDSSDAASVAASPHVSPGHRNWNVTR